MASVAPYTASTATSSGRRRPYMGYVPGEDGGLPTSLAGTRTTIRPGTPVANAASAPSLTTGAAPAPARATYGYAAGQPFGDPSKFTRGTGEAELDRFNQWMREQPWWQSSGAGQAGFTDKRQEALEAEMARQGIALPKDFYIDEGGNLNQKSRLKRNLIIAGAIGAGALTAGTGAFGLLGGAGAAGAGGGGAAGAAAGALPATSLATGSAALGGGLGLGAALPAASTAGGLLAGSTAAGVGAGLAAGGGGAAGGAAGGTAGLLPSTSLATGSAGAGAGGLGIGGALPSATGGTLTAGGGLAGGLKTAGNVLGNRFVRTGLGTLGAVIAGKQATKSAMQRSPEELAALAGATGAAGDLRRTGGELVKGGRDVSQDAINYYQTLLRGNRALQSQAVAAPTAAIQDVYRGAERNLERSGARGAAREVAAGELGRERASKIAGLITGVQPMAAEELGKLGSEQLRVGGPMLGQAGNLYGNLLREGFYNRTYGRQEGEKVGSAMGGFIRDLLTDYGKKR